MGVTGDITDPPLAGRVFEPTSDVHPADERLPGFARFARVPPGDFVTALAAVIVDPRLGGLVAVGGLGVGKSAWLDAAAARAAELAVRPVQLRPGVTEDRLLGGLDLGETLGRGRPVFAEGLLAEVDGGVLVAHSLGALPDRVLQAVGTALRHGEIRVERDGRSRTARTRFALLGARLPDEPLPSALTDGIAFHLAVGGDSAGDGGVPVRAELAASGAAPGETVRRLSERLSERLPSASAIRRAREALPHIEVPGEVISRICRETVRQGVGGHRCEWLAVRAAAAHAALAGRLVVDDTDVRWAVATVVESRSASGNRDNGRGGTEGDRTGARSEEGRQDGGTARRTRAGEGPADEPTPDGPPRGGRGDRHWTGARFAAAAGSAISGMSPPRPLSAGRRYRSFGPDERASEDAAGGQGSGRTGPAAPDASAPPEKLPAPAVRPDDRTRRLLNRLAELKRGSTPRHRRSPRPEWPRGSAGPTRRSSAGRTDPRTEPLRVTSHSSRTGSRRGGTRDRTDPGDPRRAPLAVAATLRAAIPRQPLRRREAVHIPRPPHLPHPPAAPGRRAGPPIVLRFEDLRVRRFKPRRGKLVIVAVDGSGSVGRRRLAEAKGAALHLVERAYAGRDRVALLVFQGAGATVLVPPTRSRLALARLEIDDVSLGGGTPLAAAFRQTYRLWQAERRHSRVELVLMTDGRANVASENGTRSDAYGEAVAWSARLARLPLLSTVVDTSPSPRRGVAGHAEEWATRLGGTYVWIPDAFAGGRRGGRQAWR